MAKAQKPGVDWLAIEGLYRAGSRSVNSIAAEFGIDEKSIRYRAKKNGWTRDPQGAKREIVKAAMSGVPNGLPSSEVRNAIADQAATDIVVMEEAATFSADVIKKCAAMLGNTEGAREVKILTEAVATAVSSYRRIRGLDDRDGGGNGVEGFLMKLHEMETTG